MVNIAASHLYRQAFIQSISYLDSNMELGCLLGGSRCFINSSIQVHRHGEDWSVYWPRLGEQAILQPWSDLVQTHQGVHWLVGVYGFTVEDCGKNKIFIKSKQK